MRIPRDCFANLVADLSHDTRASVARIFIDREQVAKVFNMFKKIMRFFRQNIRKYVARLSRDSRTTFMLVSRTCRREDLANLQCDSFATRVRMSYECRMTVARSLEKTCEQLATIWQENKTKRHSYEWRETLSRISCDCRASENKTTLHS